MDANDMTVLKSIAFDRRQSASQQRRSSMQGVDTRRKGRAPTDAGSRAHCTRVSSGRSIVSITFVLEALLIFVAMRAEARIRTHDEVAVPAASGLRSQHCSLLPGFRRAPRFRSKPIRTASAVVANISSVLYISWGLGCCGKRGVDYPGPVPRRPTPASPVPGKKHT